MLNTNKMLEDFDESTQDLTEEEKLAHQRFIDTMRQRELDAMPLHEKHKRSTYSETSMQRMRPYIDRAKSSMEDVCIPYRSFPSCNVNRLYQLATDALLWLCQESGSIEEAQAYWAFKGQVTFSKKSRIASEGIWIRWKERRVAKPSVQVQRGLSLGVENTNTANNVTIMNQVSTWLEEGTTPLKITGLAMTASEVLSLRNILTSAGIIDFRVELDKIIAVKP